MSSLQSLTSNAEAAEPIRVAIVDDSVVIRGLLSRWLIEAPGIDLVGSYRSGREIIDKVVEAAPDVVILDIEMPDIDGLSALPHILKARPKTTVIVLSTLTARNADISLKCLQLGATDFLLKPTSNREISTSNDFRGTFIDRINLLGAKARRRQLGIRPAVIPVRPVERPQPGLREEAPSAAPASVVPIKKVAPLPADGDSGTMRAYNRTLPKALLIGASTGGPQAVMTLLKAIRNDVSRVPVFIAQHMPAAFTMMFAEHLSKHAQLDVVQATDGEAVRAGRVYVAPGGKHMQLKRAGGGLEIAIVDTAPVNFCKPAVDVLFDSASELIGAACLAVVLTGMGVDGARGALRIAEAGGNVLAQDEATSVVWGMPGATSRAGACAAVLPIVQMAPVLSKLLAGERP